MKNRQGYAITFSLAPSKGLDGEKVYLSSYLITAPGDEPVDPHHFLHHLRHKDQDRQAGQRAPEDPTYHAGIAAALTDADQIVVVGHGTGTGHSHAARHLIEHLAAHDPDLRARVVAERVIDLPSVTPAQLLEIGRQELGE